jgi:hypothetical protein
MMPAVLLLSETPGKLKLDPTACADNGYSDYDQFAFTRNMLLAKNDIPAFR